MGNATLLTPESRLGFPIQALAFDEVLDNHNFAAGATAPLITQIPNDLKGVGCVVISSRRNYWMLVREPGDNTIISANNGFIMPADTLTYVAVTAGQTIAFLRAVNQQTQISIALCKYLERGP